MLDEGVAELVAVMEGNAHLREGAIVADLRIARGFDYYTGTVYEGMMAGFESIGSVCSGGRYDNLVSDAGGKGRFPGVGVSIGVTRILGVLIGDGRLTGSRQTPTAVLVALNSDADRPRAYAVARALRERGIATEVFHEPLKYGKQIRYADRKGIPYVWFPETAGAGVHEVRDLQSGEQVAADPATWEPAADKATPSILET
jgi:histidyl-tRNA synthetase